MFITTMISEKSMVEVDLVDEEVANDTLFKSMRGFLILGKVIGLLPYKGIFSKSSKNLSFSYFSGSTFITYGILTILTFNSVLEVLSATTKSKANAYDIAQSFRNALYNIWGTVIFFNFVTRADKFLNIFHAWRSCSVVFTKPDVHLKRDAIVISVVILTSAILENSILWITYVGKLVFPTFPRNDTLQEYYINSHQSWAKYVPYNPFFAVVAFVQHKFTLIGWNYLDILIALLGRALYFKFKALNDTAYESLVEPSKEKPRFTANPKSGGKLESKNWVQVTKDHHAICDLMNAFEEFLSPLIFISYMVNIYYICMQLLDGLTVGPQNTWTDAVNKPWSFFHLALRIYMISIWCARINMYASDIRSVLFECPLDCYSVEISRLDKRVSGAREIGLSGLGCFVLTKPFILTFIGVIFTFEIVLLQVAPSATTPPQCCCK